MTPRLALLALLFLASRAHAEPEPAPAPLDLTGARILASPGWPGALKPFLPPGREVEPLSLPLPPGPVLILGLLDKDPVARAVGESLLGWKPGHDLHGGYVVEARREGDRTLAVFLAADAAALAAARFELETFTPTGKETEPRSVEFQQPDEQGGVRIAPGRRNVRPKYRIRAAAGLGPGESLLDVVAAHANRMWVTPETSDRDLALLRDHGVEPVGWTSKGLPSVSFAGSDDLESALSSLLDLQKRGVRRFALDWRRPPGRAGSGCPQTPLARRIGDALRPGGLEELLVIPVEAGGAGLVLRDIPEAVLGWVGSTDQPLEITRAQAEQARREAGVPVVLVETWMEAAAGETPRVPSFPRGRATGLGDILARVLVLPGPGSAAAVAAAWSPPETDAFAELGDLLGACVQDAKAGSTFLLHSAACLEQTLLGRYADPPWLRGLPQRLREAAAALPPADALMLARLSPEPLTLDGKLDEAAWQRATWHDVGRLDVAAVSDGHRLFVGLRIIDAPLPAAAGVVLLASRRYVNLSLLPDPSDPQGIPFRGGNRAWSRGERTIEVEVALDHYVLQGDPYPTRYFPFDLSVKLADGVHHLGGRQAAMDGKLPGGLLILR